MRSCQTPIGNVAGKRILTLEGLGTPAKPHPLQQAFIDEQAVQCGYCVNGMIMQAKALLEDLQFSRSAVTSVDWKSYPILTFPDVPEVVMDLIDRPRERPWGAGEPTAAVVPSAIANAIYDPRNSDQPPMTLSWRPTVAKAARPWSRSARLWAAEIITRMRALP